MELRSRHWIVALVIAGLFHAALVLALIPTPTAPPQAPVTLVLEIGAGGDGSLEGGDGEEAGAPEAVSSSAPEASVPASADGPWVASSTPVLTTPDPAPPAEPEERPVSEPAPVPKPAPRKTTPARAPQAPVRSPGTERSNPDASGRRTAEAAPGNGGQAASGSGAGRGPGVDQGTGGADAYYSQLARWLNQHKRYPSQARHRRQQGTVSVKFTIDRNGRLVSHQILSSSGHSLLDGEVSAMLERASPMPKIPDSMNRPQLTVTLPITFNLR